MTAKKTSKAAPKAATGRLLYKLTDHLGQTRNETQWGEGVTHTATGAPSQDLCTNAWIHAYTSPLLAVLLNPVHANFNNPRLWKARGIVGKTDNGLKVGCRSLTTIREISLPNITATQRVAFGILCALEVNRYPQFVQWAKNWLTAKDRTAEAAWAANAAVRSASRAEVAEDVRVAWRAARAAAARSAAARSASRARAAADVAAAAAREAARAAADVAAAAAEAAEAAARAAARAAHDKPAINLVALAKRAMKVK